MESTINEINPKKLFKEMSSENSRKSCLLNKRIV